MKSRILIFFFVQIVLSSSIESITPFPFEKFTKAIFQVLWNFDDLMIGYSNQTNPYSCITWIMTNTPEPSFTVSYFLAGLSSNRVSNMNLSNSNTTWQYGRTTLNVLNFDKKQYQWVLLVEAGRNYGIMLAKLSPFANITMLIQSQIKLLTINGYNVTQNNNFLYNNTNCKNSIEF